MVTMNLARLEGGGVNEKDKTKQIVVVEIEIKTIRGNQQ
jgi:hypothetical protein